MVPTNPEKQLKPLDILLYKGTGFTSWVIEWLSKSPYSHIALVVNPGMNLGIESNTGHQAGVRAFDLRRIAVEQVDVFRLKPQYSVDQETVISYLVGHLGVGYDYWGVICLGLLKIFSLLSFTLFRPHNSFQRNKDYFCSELVWEAFASDGLDLVPQTGAADITSPGDIAKSEVVDKVSK